jgi:methylmalonyl-CoA mutase
MPMKSNDLFKEFEPLSPKAWKQKIQVDLKGGDYNELLTHTTPEGIQTKPFYTREDTEQISKVPQRIRPKSEIGYLLDPGACENPIDRLQSAFDGGAEDAILTLSPGVETLSTFFEETPPPEKSVFWDWTDMGHSWTDLLTPEMLAGYTLLADPIGQLAATGNWNRGMEEDFQQLFQNAARAVTKHSELRLCIRMDTYQQAGAHRVQELAYGLAHVHEYVLRASEDPDQRKLVQTPIFRVALGGDYFADIAKLRALRKAWAILAASAGLPETCEILAHPSLRNKTLYDFNTNMLRTSLECMAGVLGGADLVCNLPYDRLFNPPNSFGDRIARNQLLLLRHESHFDKVENPADGAYYIESLTEQMGKKALALFKSIEKGGGLLAQLKNHTIQKKIREAAEKEQQAFREGDLVLVGSNVFPNPEDRMSAQTPMKGGQVSEGRKTLIEPLPARRLSAAYEQKRLTNEP